MISVIQPRLWGACGFGNDKQTWIYVRGDEPLIGIRITESSPVHKLIMVDGDGALKPVQSFIDFPPGGWKASWGFVRGMPQGQFIYDEGISANLKSRPFTLECWAKILGDTTFDQLIMQNDNGAGAGVEFGSRANNAWVKVGAVKVIDVPAIVVYGTWQQWRLIRDDLNNIRLYVDGLLVGTAAVGDFGGGQRFACANSWTTRMFGMTGSLSGIRFSTGYCRYRTRTSPLVWPVRRW